MCDLRSGCCGCFIPYFPYRQFLEQVETSEMPFDLCQKLLYSHTHTLSQTAAPPEEAEHIPRSNPSRVFGKSVGS